MIVTPWLVATYLYDVTDVWAANNDQPPEDVARYGGLVAKLRRRAQEAGDLPALRGAIDYMLAHPELDVRRYVAQVFPYNDERARELLAFVRGELWPTAEDIPPDGPAGVEWRMLDLPEWRALPAAERGAA